MSIGLGGVSLPDDMWIENRFAEHGVAGTFRRTIGGRLLRYETTATGGAPLDLVCSENMGPMTVSTYRAVAALVGTGVLTLEYESETYSVVFRSDDPPVLDFELLVPRPNAEDDDLVHGVIKLITV